MKAIDLNHDSLPMKKVLGVQWCIDSDAFKFRITLNDKPWTRRGVLSTVSSVYDPLGFIAPVVLVGKQLLRNMCVVDSDWDSPLPDELIPIWERWRHDLCLLEHISIPRCFKPTDFGTITSVSLHHFSDASTSGYGQCSYLRLTDDQGRIHCSLVMAKARVAPLKVITIPRLELIAAVISVRVSVLLRRELEYTTLTETFYTDSQVVLGYIQNEAKRFRTFVANQIQEIRNNSEVDQWRHVATVENPADAASRGLHASELVNHSSWFCGPDFLWQNDLARRS